MKNTRPSARQLREFQNALTAAQADSARISNRLLTDLAARRDAYLASLR